jgi:hypothetical protein
VDKKNGIIASRQRTTKRKHWPSAAQISIAFHVIAIYSLDVKSNGTPFLKEKVHYHRYSTQDSGTSLAKGRPAPSKQGAAVLHLSVALGAQLLEVKVELRALKNVAVAAARLAGPRGDARWGERREGGGVR